MIEAGFHKKQSERRSAHDVTFAGPLLAAQSFHRVDFQQGDLGEHQGALRPSAAIIGISSAVCNSTRCCTAFGFCNATTWWPASPRVAA
jgi:hypothetical protein